MSNLPLTQHKPPFYNFKPKLVRSLIEDESTSCDLLHHAFMWAHTPQGFSYWNNRTVDALRGKSLSLTARRHLSRMLRKYEKEEAES